MKQHPTMTDDTEAPYSSITADDSSRVLMEKCDY